MTIDVDKETKAIQRLVIETATSHSAVLRRLRLPWSMLERRTTLCIELKAT